MRSKKNIFLVTLVVLNLLAACQPAPVASRPATEFSADVPARWFELQLKLIKETPGFTPPVSSRALGYSGVTLYETVVGGMPRYKSLVGQLNDLNSLPQPEVGQRLHWALAANSALAAITRDLYPKATPENLAAIAALEQRIIEQYKADTDDQVFYQSIAYGKSVAKAIFEWSKTDGGHEGFATNFPDSYIPPVGTGFWVPTPPNYQAALQPYWGENRPFALKAGGECDAPPPPQYSEDPSSQFYLEAYEVYTEGSNLSPEHEAIARFWADDAGKTFTPPGHSVSIATQALRQQDASLALAAQTYARVGMAVSDAFITTWNTKYIYNVIRPISYIQTVIDPEWNTPVVTDPVITPPFPEYTSGHSVQSSAAATVLTALFGDNYQFTDNTQAALGLPARTFNSFTAFAEEAAISRLYGGIHYRSAIELGLEQGQCVGKKVNGLDWKN